MILNEPFNKELLNNFLKDFLPDYQLDERSVRTPDKSILTEVTQLGVSRKAEVTALEAECEETDTNKRIAITQAAFKVLRDHGIRNAIIAFHDGADQWRLSLLTSTLEIKGGKVIKKDSNPRRYSYLLGVGAKTVTPYKYLVEKGRVDDIKQLQERFSVEVVNKQFYASIADLFTKLVGGERGATKHPGLLKINGVISQNVEHQEFAVRLIGRIIFSWFLKEKKSTAGVPIVPNELLSLDAVVNNADYYHSILEPLFFELLNKRVEHRHESLREAPFSTVPYLNGGLFSPQRSDFYNQNSFNGAGTPGLTHIPDGWFTELFTVLEQYNFTVDENTSYDVDLSIDPEMLGRIFENLLAEINPETGESARKSTGSFYTPREIVDYMVDSSLLEFLKGKTGADENKLKALISWGQSDDEDYPLTGDEKQRIVTELAGLTILDPACGSGAFPIGILQKVVYVLQQADPRAEIWLENQLKSIASPELKRDIQEKYESENYDWLRKYGVIRETIFGIDIQTIATEISKLRCFLTLIIEEEVNDDKPNRGVHALPNLDFKFVTANSLVSLPDSNAATKNKGLNLFEDVSHIEQLKNIRNQYFGANADERARLQVEFKNLQMDMLRSRIATSGATSDLYNTLSDWDPFSHKATDWFDAEWMFGIEGFDIVIANPPYVGEKGNKTTFDKLKPTSLGKRFYKGKMDLFYFFFHLGLDALKDGGVLTFITTNYYPTADGAIKLRKDFYERTNIVRLINFGEITVFDSARGQHNLITILQRSVAPGADYETEEVVASNKGSVSSGALNNVLSGDSELVSVSKVTKQGVYDSVGSSFYIRFATGSAAGDGIIEKMIQVGKPLSGYADTREGLHTGIDTVSEKDSIKFSEHGYKKGENVFVLKRGKYNFPHLRPWFKSSDIGHYTANELNESEVLYLNSQDEPTAEELSYLQRYRPLLENRSEFKAGTKKVWYELKRPRVRSMFEQEKIVNPYRSKDNFFALVRTPWFASADVFYTVSKSPQLSNSALCAVLNSKLIRYWLMNRGKRKGGMMELKSTPIGEIPLVMPATDTEAELSSLANEITDLRTGNPTGEISVQEIKINKIVYELYNLTPEEIAIVEGS
jgi:adenine-specific DNA-methyltransferase